PGSVAMRWRNAGRFMAAQEHALLLGEAMAQLLVDSGDIAGKRRGLVGSPLASRAAYACFERFGPLVADLQPWGSIWPGQEAVGDVDTIGGLKAADSCCPRAPPASVHRRALLAALLTARCVLVICQLAQT